MRLSVGASLNLLCKLNKLADGLGGRVDNRDVLVQTRLGGSGSLLSGRSEGGGAHFSPARVSGYRVAAREE